MSKDSKPSGTNPCACRFSSATGEQVVWCVVHDELREAAAELDRVFEMLDREGLERGHGRCVTKIVAGLLGEHAMLRERLEEVRQLLLRQILMSENPDIEQALFRINQALLATRPRVE